MRYLFVFLAFSLFLHASLYEITHENEDQISVLSELEIDQSFQQNSELQKLLENYSVYRRTLFLQVLSDAYIYFPLIKQMLKEANLPPSLVYMAMAESNFNNSAYSRTKAVGMWQFMPKTAKIFGLKVDEYIDERRDPIKATRAAIKYLTSLHKRFGKWYLAMMAYNCGGGRLNYAIKKAGSDTLESLLYCKNNTKRQFLPRETRNYIRKIIALSVLSEDEEMLLSSNNLHLLNRGLSYPLATVQVGAGTMLKEVAKAIDIKIDELKRLNVALKNEFVPPYANNFDLYIPYEKLARFKANFKRKNPDEKFVIYTVKAGDTLSSIGKSFGVNFHFIQDFNHLGRSSFLRLKQRLIIPIEKEERFVYKIKRGDTLSSIAKKFDLSLERIREINNQKLEVIYVGQKIIIQN
jgi:membrane-bound lytic murein transglycosylase D